MANRTNYGLFTKKCSSDALTRFCKHLRTAKDSKTKQSRLPAPAFRGAAIIRYMNEPIDLRRLNVLCYRYFMRKTSFPEDSELTDSLRTSMACGIWFNWLGGKWQRIQIVNRKYISIQDEQEN